MRVCSTILAFHRAHADHRVLLPRRYQLPIVVIIMNNSGIYGGDRRQQQLREAAHKGAAAAGFGADPEPTSFVPNAKSASLLINWLPLKYSYTVWPIAWMSLILQRL